MLTGEASEEDTSTKVLLNDTSTVVKERYDTTGSIPS